MRYQRLALIFWIAQAVVLSLLLAWVVLTLLTFGAIVSIAIAVLLAIAPRNSVVLWLSVAGAAAVAVIGVLYRAGPTSGLQLPNVAVIVLAATAFATSAMALRSR